MRMSVCVCGCRAAKAQVAVAARRGADVAIGSTQVVTVVVKAAAP
jgi:hypothetical protein